MGYKININCKACGYKEELKVGRFINEMSINNILPLLDDDNRKTVENLINTNNFISFTYSRKIGYCEKCKNICSLGVVSIYTKDGRNIELQNKCKNCKRKVVIFDIENNVDIRLLCYKCNNGELNIEKFEEE